MTQPEEVRSVLAQPLADIASALAGGETSSEELTELALARIWDPEGQGSRAFTVVLADSARASARASDLLRRGNMVRSALEGIPISVKDLCDIAGLTTLAGSRLRADAPPAKRDAVVVARLRRAGAVLVGKSNMTEFAVGTPGTNPHYGTPLNPWNRGTGHIPGGSSSGCAVSITDAMVAAGLGTDTAGSVRVPAALCGLVGFKPTARRVPLEGVFPFSHSLDSAGPLGRTVACVRAFDAVIAADEPPAGAAALSLRGLRLATLDTLVTQDLDPAVAAAYRRALSKLSSAGAQVQDLAIPALAELSALNRSGGIAGAEAWSVHWRSFEERRDEFDPRVAEVLERAASISAREYIELVRVREAMMADTAALTRRFDAIVMPTCPLLAPTIEELENAERWHAVRGALLRNNVIANFLDRPALSIPCHLPGEAPVGLMLMGETLGDSKILDVGEAMERELAP